MKYPDRAMGTEQQLYIYFTRMMAIKEDTHYKSLTNPNQANTIFTKENKPNDTK